MAARRIEWPEWWFWELDTSSPHLLKRMMDRRFTEADLREMLESATGFHPNHEEGRWGIETEWGRARWEVIVEPMPREERLVVVTAYKTEPQP